VPVSLSLMVNGKAVRADVDSRTLLVEFLRRDLGLTGTHVGCDTAQCGACTVHVDGRAVKSCNLLAAQLQGANVTTIEGITGPGGELHPMQAAFKDCHGLQCGFCTTGMVMSALELVQRHPDADEQKIREELEGNLCRCTGYHNIIKAVRQGAAAMAK
jgi:aerobic carbon-monoxide dehydrogenase small subunit